MAIRHSILLLLFAACSVSSAPSVVPGKTIVFIITDDQARDTLVAMPQTVGHLGPGNGGVQFTRAIVSTPLCCPERTTLLTGLTSSETGVIDTYHHAMNVFDDSRTLATSLQAAGWKPALFGKYGNQYRQLWKSGQPPYVPPGWDRWHVFVQARYSGGNFVCKGGPCASPTLVPMVGHETHAVFSAARKHIASTSGDLFVWIAPYAPHREAEPADQDKGAFKTLPHFRPPSWQQRIIDGPAPLQTTPPWTAEEIAARDALRRRQHNTLRGVDREMDLLVQTLKDTGRWDDAHVIYTSDNGHNYGEHVWSEKNPKNCPYLECVNVPLLVRSPGALPRVDARPVSAVDLTATIVEWAGAALPYAQTKGRSLVELLADPAADWREAAYVEVRGGQPTWSRFRGVYTATDNYIEWDAGGREHYDETIDPWQTTNRAHASERSGRVAYLQWLLATLKP